MQKKVQNFKKFNGIMLLEIQGDRLIFQIIDNLNIHGGTTVFWKMPFFLYVFMDTTKAENMKIEKKKP